MAKVRPEGKFPRSKSGTVLTPEVTDQIAEEAERGYDLSTGRRRLVGRPSLSGNGTSPRISLRLTPQLYEAARKRATEEGRSLSDLTREALELHIGPLK